MQYFEVLNGLKKVKKISPESKKYGNKTFLLEHNCCIILKSSSKASLIVSKPNHAGPLIYENSKHETAVSFISDFKLNDYCP